MGKERKKRKENASVNKTREFKGLLNTFTSITSNLFYRIKESRLWQLFPIYSLLSLTFNASLQNQTFSENSCRKSSKQEQIVYAGNFHLFTPSKMCMRYRNFYKWNISFYNWFHCSQACWWNYFTKYLSAK